MTKFKILLFYVFFFDSNAKLNMYILLCERFSCVSETPTEIFAFDFEYEKWKLMALCTVYVISMMLNLKYNNVCP